MHIDINQFAHVLDEVTHDPQVGQLDGRKYIKLDINTGNLLVSTDKKESLSFKLITSIVRQAMSSHDISAEDKKRMLVNFKDLTGKFESKGSTPRIFSQKKAQIEEARAVLESGRNALRSEGLMKMNQEILDIREKIEFLTELSFSAPSAQKPVIQQQKAELIDRHTALIQEKINFVKAEFPENPVYALAIPQTLKKGTVFSSSGTLAKMNAVKANGIISQDNRPATHLAANAPQTRFGGNEMGERGIYFSMGEPAYLGDDLPTAIGCELLQDVEGFSLMPISILERAGFTNEQIDKAYDQIQKKSVFLQHDGLYPANSEVVFLKNQRVLKITKEFQMGAGGAVIETPLSGQVHASWQ